MSTLLSPFVTKDITCPACKKPSTQRFFRQRVYVPEDRESDQHVCTYRYMDERYRQVHPPYYFLYYCPLCRFTDTTEEYVKPQTNDSAQQVMRQYRRLSDQQQLVINLLGSQINYDEIDFPSAVNLHSLAVFIQRLPEEESVDAYKVARLFLRMAWLFREVEGTPTPTSAPAESQSASPAKARILARAKASRVDAPQEVPGEDLCTRIMQAISGLDRHFDEANTVLNELNELTKRRKSEIAQTNRESGDYPYETCASQITLLFNKNRELLNSLKKICEKDVANSTSLQQTQKESSQESVAQLRVFLKQVKSMWPEQPLDEKEATEAAIRYFRIAMERDPRLTNHDAYLKIVLLVCDLYGRCDDYASAITLIRGIYQSAVDERKACTEQLQADGVSAIQRNRLKTRLDRVNASLEQTGEYRRMLLDELREREMPRINAVMERFSHAPERIEEALLKLGLPPDLLHRLKERGGPLEFLRQTARR